jgi:23S rRNA (guanosine2251-2'-O)-methyltransferase
MKDTYIIYGKHAVLSAIDNPNRKVHEILCIAELKDSMNSTFSSKAPVRYLTNAELKQLTYDSPHQGIAAKVSPLTLYNIPKKILSNPQSKFIILDQITDPQNVGAILRSAAAFGINAVIYPKHGNAAENGTVAKAACGALDTVPLIEVVNIAQTLTELKKDGFWIIGLDGNAKQSITSSKNLFDGKLAVVLGSEGSGIRPLIAKTCDLLVKLPISSSMESLNVSNAAAIVMWEISKN